MTVQKHDVVAGSGILSGLATIFLTLTQSLPGGLTSNEVIGAVASGALLIVSSLGYHGVITKAQTAKVTKLVQANAPEVETALSQIPVAQQAAHDASTAVVDLGARVKKLEDNPVTTELVSLLRNLTAAQTSTAG